MRAPPVSRVFGRHYKGDECTPGGVTGGHRAPGGRVNDRGDLTLITTEPMEDLYELLGVPPNASGEEIGAAYSALSAGAPAGAALQRAYAMLSDPERRRVYDYSRVDPRGLRAALGVGDRKEKVVWNVQGRAGEEPPPVEEVDPWGLKSATTPTPDPPSARVKAKKTKKTRRSRSVAADQPSTNIVEPDKGSQAPAAVSATRARQDADHGDPSADASTEGIAGSTEVGQGDGFLEASSDQELVPDSHPTPVEQVAPGREAVASVRTARKRPKKARTEADSTPPTPVGLSVDQDASEYIAATTLTSYQPPDPASLKPRRSILDMISQLGVAALVVAAIAGGALYWRSNQEGDENRVERPTTAGAEDEAAVLATLASPPDFETGALLPEELKDFASQSITEFVAEDGHRYHMLGVTAVQTDGGEYFYAAVGRNTSSFDGTGQRVFFFLDRELLGTDWPEDTRSVRALMFTAAGALNVAYASYGVADETCCPSLDETVVSFTYNGGLVSDSPAPPRAIFAAPAN